MKDKTKSQIKNVSTKVINLVYQVKLFISTNKKFPCKDSVGEEQIAFKNFKKIKKIFSTLGQDEQNFINSELFSQGDIFNFEKIAKKEIEHVDTSIFVKIDFIESFLNEEGKVPQPISSGREKTAYNYLKSIEEEYETLQIGIKSIINEKIFSKIGHYLGKNISKKLFSQVEKIKLFIENNNKIPYSSQINIIKGEERTIYIYIKKIESEFETYNESEKDYIINEIFKKAADRRIQIPFSVYHFLKTMNDSRLNNIASFFQNNQLVQKKPQFELNLTMK